MGTVSPSGAKVERKNAMSIHRREEGKLTGKGNWVTWFGGTEAGSRTTQRLEAETGRWAQVWIQLATCDDSLRKSGPRQRLSQRHAALSGGETWEKSY